MLELDYLLQNYLQNRFASMGDSDINHFARLLETPDALLLEYLMGRSVPMDPEMARVVREIRTAT
jgi:succinate dehydrogenase flavin-adding protein (antitoxin of CptAB toxin-antitoxin module)